jgi:hypothetical protein
MKMAKQKASKRSKGTASRKPVAVACTRLLGDWILCSDELPRPSKEVLCHCEDGIIKIMWRDDFATMWMWTDGEGPHLDKDEVTHWMPLPNPPNKVI